MKAHNSTGKQSDEQQQRQQGAKTYRPKPGILRLDVNKPRRLSGGSVEFRDNSQILGEDTHTATAVTSSPHQLSVTWATPFDANEIQSKPTDYFGAHTNSSSAAKIFPQESSISASESRQSRSQLVGERIYEYEIPSFDILSNDFQGTDLREFDEDIFGTHYNNSGYRDKQQHITKVGKHEKDDEEDYSISVSAIMQRRASVRGYRNKRGSRSSRRASSTMDHVFDATERRRSSVYTTSSDEGTNQESTQEQIFENIRLHKEVIQSVKLQPWPMRKKLKLVRQAKTYVARHEGALQERFAMSRSTRDLWARFKILMAARWRHWKREMASFATTLIPWELRIKEIESHFGSGVASYFTFLRWLMSVNIMIAIPLVAFVIGPEYFATTKNETDPRKRMTEQEFKVAGNLFTIWEFEGYLKYSPMFYGYYSSFSGASKRGYKLPLAYFLTSVLVYVYSFVATLKKMAENSRNSKLSSKDDECTFSWKLFTGWDFMIGHAETAHNRVASVVVGFKEALLEEAEKKKDNHNWRIILQRILVNILVVGLLVASGYTVVKLVNESGKLAMQDNWLSRNAVNVTMTLLSFFLPMIFEALGILEKWHPRQQLRLQLARIMMLNLLNLYALMFSFIYNITSKEKPLQELKKKNETATLEFQQLLTLISSLNTSASNAIAYSNLTTLSTALVANPSSTPFINNMSILNDNIFKSIATVTTTAVLGLVNRIQCQNITVRCSKPMRVKNHQRFVSTTLLLMNLSTTALPPTAYSNLTTPNTTFNTNTLELITIPPSTILPTTTYNTTGVTDILKTSTINSVNTSKTKPRTILTATTMTSTVVIPQLTTSIKYEQRLTSLADNTAINITKDESTFTANEDESTTIDMEELATTTTTMLPTNNDTFFDYYDYFAGLPVDLETVDIEEDEDKTTTTQTNLESKNLVRKARQVTVTATETTPNNLLVPVVQLPFTVPPFRKSIYSRRKHDGFSTIRGIYGSGDSDETSTSTLASNITTNFPWNYVTKTIVLDTTSTDTTEIDSSTIMTTESTTSTDTFTTVESRENDGNTIIPYFIDDEDIIEIGEPSYYDSNDINIDKDDVCIRRICKEITQDSLPTTASNLQFMNLDAYEIVTPSLTPLQQHEMRLNKVQKTLREIQKNLTGMCWETTLGQELSKVIVFDGLMGILVPLCIDFLRAVFVRYGNRNFCWDMEKTFPQYGDFKIAENILSLIYNQGQVWMGIFFSPGLVLINLAKLVVMMYFRSFIVLTCNVPHEVVFKASKSNNFYLTLLLTMLFLCVLPVGYAIVWLRPSWHCGPFSNYNRISEFITNTTRNALPKQLHEPLDYLTSSSTVIPLLLLLILIIYYLVSLTGALREANQDLRTQLHKEREEERKKMFKVHETKANEPSAAALSSRWRKVLEASSPVTPTQPPDFETEEYKSKARKELISRIMKNALRKGSATSDEDSMARHGRDDDDTDTEHHDSLPLDEDGKDNRLGPSKFQHIRKTRKPSLVDIVQIAKYERDRERAAAISGTNNTNGARPRLKIDRQERKERDIKSETNNDPEINTRIVNERRQSLLRRKREEDEENNIECKSNDHRCDEGQRPLDSSHYAVIDEKKNKQIKNTKNNEDEDVKINTKKKKKEEKAKHTKVNTLNGENDIILEGSETIDISIPTTPNPTADKFSNFSKLGRKKFNNFLALVRDAVNANKNDTGDIPSSPKLPEVDGELADAASFYKNEQHNFEICPTTAIAIDIPLTPKEQLSHEVLASAFEKVGEETKVQNSLEEVDQPGPIVFTNNNNASQRRKAMERASPIRQDSKSSLWSDNIPTIMISMGSDECIVQPENIAELSLDHQITAPQIEVSPIDSTPIPTSPATMITSEPTVVTSTQSTTPAGAVINIIKVELEDTE